MDVEESRDKERVDSMTLEWTFRCGPVAPSTSHQRSAHPESDHCTF